MADSASSSKKNPTATAAVVSKSKHPKVHNKDRISNLPESLLSQILSLLPTEEALATSILSKRWRYLWTSITNLHLYDYLMSSPSPTKNLQPPTNFINYVNRILLLHDSPSIHQFSLILVEFSDLFHINKWICDAVTRNIRELELGLPVFGGEEDLIQLPRSLFDCKTLEILKLGVGFEFNIPKSGSVSFPKLMVLHLDNVCCGEIPAEEGSICFPVLKILHLLYVQANDDSLTKLMRNCPVLEDLSIDTEYHTSIEICAPALRRAKFAFDGDSCLCEIQIDAPALRYLSIIGWDLSQELVMKGAYSLIEAKLIYLYHYPDFTEEQCYNAYKLIKAVDKVQSLLVSGRTVKEHQLCGVEEKWWTELACVPKCLLSTLKRVEIRNVVGCTNEVDMIKYILKNAKILEKIAIQTRSTGIELRKRYQLLQNISLFPRGSTECEVAFS